MIGSLSEKLTRPVFVVKNEVSAGDPHLRPYRPRARVVKYVSLALTPNDEYAAPTFFGVRTH